MFDLGEIRGRIVLEDDFTSVLVASATALDGAALAAQRIGRKFEEAGRLLSFGLTAPLTAAATAAITMSNRFESTITKLTTISNIGVQDLERMRKAALELAPVVGVGPQELADALVVITSTGLSASTALEVLERSAKASAIGLGSTKDIARAVTSAIIAYGEENLNAAQATDQLLAAVRFGGAEANEFAESLGRVIGIASTVGVSFQELTTYVATFTRLGIDADEAVTALRGTLSALSLKAGKQAREAMDALGMSMAELRRRIKDEGLTETMIKLVEAAKGNEDAMGKIIPNVRALAGVLGTAGVQAENLRDGLRQVTNSAGDLDRAFEIASKTGAFKWAQVIAKIKTEFTEFGDALVKAGVLDTIIGLFDKLIDTAKAATVAFGQLSKPTQEFILILGAAAIALGPVLRIFGTVTRVVGYLIDAIGAVAGSTVVKGFIGFLVDGASALGTFLLESELVADFLLTMVSGPFAAVVAAGGAFTLAIRAITGDWDFLLEPLKDGWGILKDLSLIFYDLAVIVGKEVLKFLGEAYDWTVSWVPEIKNLLTNVKEIVDPFNLWAVALSIIRGHIEWMIQNGKIAAGVIGGLAAATGIASGRVPQVPALPPNPLAGLVTPPKLPPMFTGKIPLPGAGGTSITAGIPSAEELKKLKEMEELYARINTVTIDLTEDQKEWVLWLDKRKVSESDISKLMNISLIQIRETKEEEKFLMDIRKLADKQAQEYMEGQIKKAEGLAKAVLANLKIQQNAEAEADRMRRQQTMTLYDFQRSEIAIWERDQLASVDKTVAGWGRAMDAIVDLANMKYDEAADAASLASYKMAADAYKVENAWTDVFSNFPRLIQDAFTGGGGLAGALDAFVSDAGSVLGRAFTKTDIGVKIFGGISNAIGKIAGSKAGFAFAGASGDIAAAFGSLAGPLIDKTLGDGILGTAAQFALMGAMFGPWGAAAGAAIGAVIGAVEKLKNTTKQAREEFAKTEFGLSLGQLYDQLSGLGPGGQELTNIGRNIVGRKDEAANQKWMQDVKDFYTDLTNKVETFLKRTDVLWSTQIKQFAANSPEFGEFIKTQLTAAGSGLESFLTIGGDALKSMKDIKKQMSEIDEKRRDLSERGIFSGKEVDDLDKQWDELNKTLKEQQGIWEGVGIASQGAATAIGGGLAGIFAGLLEKGVPILDIVKQLTPAVDAFKQQLIQTGFDGGAAFAQISGMIDIANDKVAGPILQATQNFGGALVNLNNTGLLTKDMFKDLSGQVGIAYDKIVGLGFDGDQALRLMQPTLQTLWELEHDFGFETDEATQALIDQAAQAGIVGDKFRDPMERMILAMERVVTILELIAIKLGALPSAAADAAGGIDSAFSRGTDYNVRIHYRDDEMPDVRPGGRASTTSEDGMGGAGGGGTAASYVASNPTTPGMMVQPAQQNTIIIQALDSQSAADWLARSNNAETLAHGIAPVLPKVVEFYYRGEGQ